MAETTHVTVNNDPPVVKYVGNGATDAFDFDFTAFSISEVQVYLDDDLQEDGFTVVGNAGFFGGFEGGTVTFDTPPGNGVRVTITYYVQLIRVSDFSPGFLDENVLNTELDRLVAGQRQLENAQVRALTFPVTDPAGLTIAIPPAATRANKVLGFGADGSLAMSNLTLAEIEDGATGPQGEEGPQGPAGNDGLFSGGEATVTVSGSDKVPVLDADDGDAPKLVSAQGIADLAPAGAAKEAFVAGGSGTSLVLDGDGKSAVAYEMTGNTTISSTNITAGSVYTFVIQMAQDGTGGHTVTMPAGTVYPYGEIPEFPTDPDEVFYFSLSTWDGGTSWLVSMIGAEYA
jgi:hypothetical protein